MKPGGHSASKRKNLVECIPHQIKTRLGLNLSDGNLEVNQTTQIYGKWLMSALKKKMIHLGFKPGVGILSKSIQFYLSGLFDVWNGLVNICAKNGPYVLGDKSGKIATS